jgi:hypothetical protein
MSLRRARWVNGLLVAAALAATGVAVLTSGSITTAERVARENNVFRSWRPGELRRVRIVRPGEGAPAELVLTRRDGSSDPHDFALGTVEPRKADPGAVSELLAALEYATWARRIDPKAVDRKAMGLDAPHLELLVGFRGAEYRLLVGAEAPTPQGARYAELSGPGGGDGEMGLVGRDLLDALAVDQRAFLGSQLLPYARSEVTHLELRGAGGERRLVRDARGWRLDGPEGLRADTTSVDGLFFQMARVSAGRYLDAEEARRLLATGPNVEVIQTPASGAAVRVRLGGTCPGGADSVVALRDTDPEVAGCVPATVLPALLTPAEELVDRTPFPFRPDEVDHITLVEGGEVLELVRTGSRFDLVRPRASEVELDAGNDFVQSLVNPAGELARPADGAAREPLAGTAPPAATLSPPRGKATLRGLVDGSEQPVELTVSYGGPDERGRRWVRRHDDGALLLLSAERASAFSTDPGWARSRHLLQVDRDAITRVRIQEGGTKRAVERTTDGSLRLVEPAGFDLDGGLAADWVTTASQLRAVRWLPADSRTTEGDDGVRVAIDYRADGGEHTLEMQIGERTAGGYRTQLLRGGAFDENEPKRAHFVLPAEAYRAFATLPISRLTMTPDVEHLERVRLETAGTQVELERRAGELVLTEGQQSSSSAAAFEQALAQLHPEAAVHTGPPRAEHGLNTPELVLRGEVRLPGRAPERFTYRFGRVGLWQGRTVQFARAEGIEATFAFDRALVQQLLDRM